MNEAQTKCRKILDSELGRGQSLEMRACHTFCEGIVPEVMQSGAGWYIGAMADDEGCRVPQCRMTQYFPTQEEAQAYLDRIIGG